MPASELPTAVKRMLAREEVRAHHHLWHYVRGRPRWNELPEASRDQLRAAGWAPPRFEDEPGGGLDFLFMHRRMIDMVDQALAHANDPSWPRVQGWDPIPWAEDDPDWPVPDWPDAHPGAADARRPASVASMRRAVAEGFRNAKWLSERTLDEVGTTLEFSIHAWMHLRWSGPAPADTDSLDPSNNWLFVPWSSHVNPAFWKLHGWIDATITEWEKATGQSADFRSAWDGPSAVASAHNGMKHATDPSLLRFIQSRRLVPLPMLPKDEVIEGLPGGGVGIGRHEVNKTAGLALSASATKELVVTYQVPDTSFERLLLDGVELPRNGGTVKVKLAPGSYVLRAQAKTRPNAEYDIEITAPEEAKWKPDPKWRSDSHGVVNDRHTLEIKA